MLASASKRSSAGGLGCPMFVCVETGACAWGPCAKLPVSGKVEVGGSVDDPVTSPEESIRSCCRQASLGSLRWPESSHWPLLGAAARYVQANVKETASHFLELGVWF